MTTKLDGELRRELTIGKVAYTLILTPEGFTLALKGRRKGLAIGWAELVSGDAALAAALNASLTANIRPQEAPVTAVKMKKKRPGTKGATPKGGAPRRKGSR